jgi:ketosteroid isomerase-like protein
MDKEPEVGEADVALVRELYERFAASDLDRVREILNEGLMWVEPAGCFIPEAAGTTRGLDAVFKVFARYPDLWESFEPTPQEFYDAGDGIVFVIGEQRGRSHSGRQVAASFINLWQVEKGRITVHRSWSDTKTLGAALAD